MNLLFNKKNKQLFVRYMALCLMILSSPSIFSKVIRVGLEPLAPLVQKSGEGKTINMLKKIEEISDFRFEIHIMTYGRAKKELVKGHLDLIGHTPYKREVKSFYVKAIELNISLPTYVDLYVVDPNFLNLDFNEYPNKSIGVPVGNLDFTHSNFKIPKEKFITNDLEGLCQMLPKGRIKAIAFERGAVRSCFKKFKIKNFKYRTLDLVPAGFAVQRNSKGRALKKTLDSYFKIIMD